MGKKNHKSKPNAKKTATINAYENSRVEYANFGANLQDPLLSVGILFEHLQISHMNYLGLLRINEFCKQYAGIDFGIFSQHGIVPWTQMQCPVYDIKDLRTWDNVVVATSISTCLGALALFNHPVYYYAFDPEFLYNENLSSYDVRRAYCDQRVIVITRHRDHKNLIEEEFGIRVSSNIVEDFDLIEMLRIIHLEQNNDRTTGEKGYQARNT